MPYSIEYFRCTPPRCVRSVASEPYERLRAHIESELESLSFSWFGIQCVCQCDVGSLMGAASGLPDDPHWGSPLAFRCSDCGVEHAIFDASLDGYDAEIGAATDLANSGESAALACRVCACQLHQVAIAFGYQMSDVRADEFQGRDEDFFDACLVYVRCTGCGTISQPCVFECA